MGKVICIANQKGGVGKTTTCVNLGIALAIAGKRVCLIDSDPQGSLTESLGYQLHSSHVLRIWARNPSQNTDIPRKSYIYKVEAHYTS